MNDHQGTEITVGDLVMAWAHDQWWPGRVTALDRFETKDHVDVRTDEQTGATITPLGWDVIVVEKGDVARDAHYTASTLIAEVAALRTQCRDLLNALKLLVEVCETDRYLPKSGVMRLTTAREAISKAESGRCS